MVNRNLCVEKDGVFVYRDSMLGERRKTDHGWEKGWVVENVYGWRWVGPLDRYPYADLVVLPYEPGAEERAAIEARFANAPTPDGGPELRDPFEGSA